MPSEARSQFARASLPDSPCRRQDHCADSTSNCEEVHVQFSEWFAQGSFKTTRSLLEPRDRKRGMVAPQNGRLA